MSAAHRISRTPAGPVFAVLAASVVLGIAAQVFLAGLAVFGGAAGFDLHGAFGGALSLPILALVVLALRRGPARRFLGHAAALLVLYILQFVLIVTGRETGLPVISALHPANAVVLTTVAVLLARRAIG